MGDKRWDDLAEVFCRSTSIRPGDKVMIEAIELDTIPLMIAAYKKALGLGAISVRYKVILADIERYFLQNADNDQLDFFPYWDLSEMEDTDVYMAFRARNNSLYLKGIPSERIARSSQVLDPIIDERVANTRWCITRIPTDHDAVLAGMSTQDYMDFYFSAVLQDYDMIKENNSILVGIMEDTDQVEISAPGTEIEFSIAGIGVKSCHGERNIPDGEVCTSPVLDSVNGRISYNVPSIYGGRDWSGVQFVLEDGVIVSSGCDQGESEIIKILDIDEGARRIGEFAIGTNPGIRVPAKNSLFDEKILGSFHLTPGFSDDDIDNGNRSSIHWDLVRILLPEYGGGTISFDGSPIMIDGKFVHPDLLCMNPS
jgi:aminopeptidase